MNLSKSILASPAYLLDRLDLDYRSEVMAAELLTDYSTTANPVPLGQLLFNPIGTGTRPYTKDFSPPKFLALGDSDVPYLLLDTPREGLYDQLPPFLFHPITPNQGVALDKETVLDQLRQAKLVEQETRRFFLPFDTEFYYLRMLRYRREQENDQLGPATGLLQQLAEGWPVLRALDPAMASLFVHLLPFIHQLRGNIPWLAELLSILFSVSVRLETEQPFTYSITEAPVPGLGQCRLGLDAVVGTTFADGYNAVHLHVGPVPARRVAEFLPGRPPRQLLAQVLGYFVPASIEVVGFFHIQRTRRSALKLRRLPRAEFKGQFYATPPLPAPRRPVEVAAGLKARFQPPFRAKFKVHRAAKLHPGAGAEFAPPPQPVYLGYNSYLEANCP